MGQNCRFGPNSIVSYASLAIESKPAPSKNRRVRHPIGLYATRPAEWTPASHVFVGFPAVWTNHMAASLSGLSAQMAIAFSDGHLLTRLLRDGERSPLRKHMFRLESCRRNDGGPAGRGSISSSRRKQTNARFVRKILSMYFALRYPEGWDSPPELSWCSTRPT